MERGRLGLLHLEYNTGLFDAATIAADGGPPAAPPGRRRRRPGPAALRLPLLAADGAHQLSREWGGADAPRGARAGPCIHELFDGAGAAARRTRRPWPPRPMAVTYGELDGGPTRWPTTCGAGRRPGGRGSGSASSASLAMVVGLLGILKAGGAYVPLDPAYPAERLAFHAGGRRCAGQASRSSSPARGLPARIPRVLPRASWSARRRRGRRAAAASRCPARPLAYVIYTSGSTGRPKGVVEHPRATSARSAGCRAPRLGPAPGTSAASSTPSPSISRCGRSSAPLLSGGRLVIVPRDVVRSPRASCALLAAARRDRAQLRRPRRSISSAAAVEDDGPPALACAWCSLGGEALDPRRLARLAATARRRQPRVLNVLRHHRDHRPLHVPAVGPRRTPRSVAHRPPASPTSRCYVLDRAASRSRRRAGRALPRRPGVARGYLGRPDLTAERFVPDPFAAAAGRAPLPHRRPRRAGCPTATLEFLGRIDHQVKVRGFRIELGEIEAAPGPAPRRARLRGGRPRARLRRPGDRGRTCVLGSTGAEPDPAELRAFLQQTPAGAHGARGLRAPRRPPLDPQRQGGPQGPAGARAGRPPAAARNRPLPALLWKGCWWSCGRSSSAWRRWTGTTTSSSWEGTPWWPRG